jgi:hypothetical protein
VSKRGWRVYHRPDGDESAAVPAWLLVAGAIVLALAGAAIGYIVRGGI